MNGGDHGGTEESIQAPPLDQRHKEPRVMREGRSVQKDVQGSCWYQKAPSTRLLAQLTQIAVPINAPVGARPPSGNA